MALDLVRRGAGSGLLMLSVALLQRSSALLLGLPRSKKSALPLTLMLLAPSALPPPALLAPSPSALPPLSLLPAPRRAADPAKLLPPCEFGDGGAGAGAAAASHGGAHGIFHCTRRLGAIFSISPTVRSVRSAMPMAREPSVPCAIEGHVDLVFMWRCEEIEYAGLPAAALV